MLQKLFISIMLCVCLFASSYENGIEFYKKGLYGKAIDSFLIATNNNDNKAMLAMGIIYANGDGVKKDKELSKQWFKKAANAGNAHAMSKLGNIYASKEEYKKAFKWFKKAADVGDAKAAYNLGYFFTGGLGVDANLKMALIWYEKSAKSGNIDAQINLGFMYIAGHGTKVDYKKAAYWIKKAKDTGNVKANLMWKEFKLEEYGNSK